MPLRLQRLLTLTPELGPGIIPGARLTRLSFLLTGTQVLTKCQDSTRLVRYRSLPKQIGAIRGTDIFSTKQMAGPIEGGGPEGTDDREETPPLLTKEQIEGHVSALKSLIKSHNRKNKGDPIRLDFKMVDTEVQGHNVVKGKEVTDEDLRKPFKEARSTPFTRRIIEFAGPEYKMPNNIKLYDGTSDPEDHLSRFADLREAFAARFSVRRAYFKDPHEITKIIRKANKCIQRKVDGGDGFHHGGPMMERLDDFVHSEEAYANTKLPKGETGEAHHKIYLPFLNGRDTRPFRGTRPVESRRDEYKNNYRGKDAYCATRARDDRAPYPYPRGEYNYRAAPVLTIDYLTKYPKEILATETQLPLPVPRPMLNPLRSGNTDRYCDYHQEKGHYTNDCIQLRKQLEIALELGKLNHLLKDVRQRGRGSYGRDDPQPAKIINVISVNSVKDKKRKVREATESWMNIPISFPAISSEDISEEPLIVETEVEGYLVRRVYVDEGSSMEVMFEHCFENLSPKIKARLRETHTDLVGFAGEVSKPLGKIELEVCFGNEGLCKKTSMKFIVERALSPYNIILGRPGRLEKKQMIEENPKGKREVAVTEEVLVNPSFPDQLVTIGRGLSKTCRDQLRCLLKDNMSVFAWESFDMTACPKDYYPLPNIDCKVEYVMGFKYKCFLDAYKGYHQIQMAKEDEEKMAFYTDQGTYCYTKMPFGLKNAGAKYHSTFQSQIGRNLEAYVDDMLNPKKCSFRVEEGKFMGYMVTSEGIRANPKKTRALERITKKRTKNKAKTTKPDSEWKRL
ncbi:hypothetical protein Tco_1049075 [Tanacetum coccineum]